MLEAWGGYTGDWSPSTPPAAGRESHVRILPILFFLSLQDHPLKASEMGSARPRYVHA